MSLIESLRTAGLLAYDMNYGTGSIVDSVSGNSPSTINVPVNWSRSNKSRGIYFNKTGYLAYPSTTANNLIGGQSTIIVFGGPFNWSDGARLVSKRSGTMSYDFYLTNSIEGISLYDGTRTASLAISIKGSKFLACTNISGQAPKFYKDGNYVGNGGDNIIPINSNSPIYIGNFNTGTTPLKSIISRVIGISKALSSTEIAQVYDELLSTSICGGAKPYVKAYSLGNSILNNPNEVRVNVNDGDMEAVDTSAWTAFGSPNSVLSKQTSSPAVGTRYLRATRTSAFCGASQNINKSIGGIHRITGYMRGDGTAAPLIMNGTATGTIIRGTSSTTWQYIDALLPSNSNTILLATDSGSGSYVEFDGIQITEVFGNKGLKLRWLLDRPTDNRLTTPDLSGNGYNGTNSNVSYSRGLLSNTSAQFQGDINSNITLTNGLTNTIGSNDYHSISLWINCKDFSNQPILFMNGTGTYYLIALASGTSTSALRWRSGSSNADYNVILRPNEWYHICLVKTGTTTGSIYVNGVALVQTGNLATIGTTPGDLRLGAYTSSTLHFKGSIQDFRIYAQNLKTQEINTLYYDGAKRLNVYIPMKNCTEETLQNITTYGPIQNTPFTVRPNTYNAVTPIYNIVSRSNRKYICYTGSGAGSSLNLVQPICFNSNQAFGTWMFRVKPPTGYTCHISIIGDKQQYEAASGKIYSSNGSYWLAINGSATPYIELAKSTSSGTGTRICRVNFTNDYNSVAVTRDYRGIFTIYGKLGNNQWQLLSAILDTNPSSADLTYTISNEVMMIMGQYLNYCHFGDFRFHEGVLTLDQIKSMYPTG